MPDSNSFTRSQPWVQKVGSSSRAAATETSFENSKDPLPNGCDHQHSYRNMSPNRYM